MKVWFKIQKINRIYYKQMYIKNNNDIRLFEKYISLKKIDQKNKQQSQNISNNNSSNNEIKNQSIELQDEKGMKLKTNLQCIYPASNFECLNQLKGVNNVYSFIQKLLQNQNPNYFKSQIFISQNKKYQSATALINQPNIVKCIQHLMKQQNQNNQNNLIKINNKYTFYLMDSQFPQSFNQKNIKKLKQYFKQLVDRLLMVQEIRSLKCNILSNRFIANIFKNNGQSENQQTQNQQQKKQTKNQLIIKQYNFLNIFFNYLQQNKSQFWVYNQLELNNIFELYQIFFNECQIKLSIFFREQTCKITKIKAVPFVRFTDKTLGRDYLNKTIFKSTNDDCNNLGFKGKIFDILLNSCEQMKNFYKIPNIQANNKLKQNSTTITLQKLIQIMSNVGFKMSQISSLIRNFSFAMNINLLKIQEQFHSCQYSPSKKSQNRNYNYVVIANDFIYKNVKAIYGLQILELLISIILGIKNQDNVHEQQLKITLIKKQNLAKIIWEESIARFAREINIKLENKNFNIQKNQMKQFSLFCLSNSFNYTQKQSKQKPFEKGSLNNIQYQKIGQKIILNDLKTYQKLYQKISKKQQKDFDCYYIFKSFIQQEYQYALEKNFSSLNQLIVKEKQLVQKNYQVLKRSDCVKTLIQETLHSQIVNDTYLNYFQEFYAQEQIQQVQNNFLICADYNVIIDQQNQGQKSINFLANLIRDQIQMQQQISQNIAEQQQNPKNIGQDQLINQVQAQDHSQKNKNGNKRNQKRQIFIMTSNNSFHQQQTFSPTLIRTMKNNHRNQNISMNLSKFIEKYLYVDQIKNIYRIYKRSKRRKQPYEFDILKIRQNTQQTLIKLFQQKYNRQDRKGRMYSPTKLHQGLIIYSLSFQQNTHRIWIQLRRKIFENIQFNEGLQKNHIKKIINLFRKFKWRRNDKIYFQKLKRNKKLNQIIQKISKSLKGRYLFHIKSFLTFSIIGWFIRSKKDQITKEVFNDMKLIYILNKINQITMKIFGNSILINQKIAFTNIKKKVYLDIFIKKLKQVLSKGINETKQNVIKKLAQKPYQLIVTSPEGKIKNMQQLSLDLNQVNQTAISNPHNQNTSNVQNKFCKDKSFSNFDRQQQNQPIKEQNNYEKKVNQQENQKKDQELIQPQNTSPQQKQNQSPNKTQNQILTPKQNQFINDKNEKNGPSILSGSLVSFKSDKIQNLTKQQLFSLKDSPNFSFQLWAKQIGVKFSQQQKPTCEVLFRKYQSQKSQINKEKSYQIDQQRFVKERIIVNDFKDFINDNGNKLLEEKMQTLLTFSKKALQKPILKHYKVEKIGNVFQEMFNNILKISLEKNTSKKLHELINLIIKPIRQAYKLQKQKTQSIFNDQPLILNSYNSDYNILLDQMFLQFFKQFMQNENRQSMKNLTLALQIITRNYYPSMKMFYSYVNIIKLHEFYTPDWMAKIYQNLAHFIQAVEGNKSNFVRIFDGALMKTQIQCIQYLQPRLSPYSQQQIIKQGKLYLKLFNEEIFQFKVRNETFKTIKKRFLNQLGFLQSQSNFGLYQQISLYNFQIIEQNLKVIDFLNRNTKKQNYDKNQTYFIYLRIKQYYPIKFKDINALRIFYLNMIGQEPRYPWRQQEYENVVALSVSFDEFQQHRISNYMRLAKKQGSKDPDLNNIKRKLASISQNAQKKICQFQYFKVLKQANFLLAKVYTCTTQNSFIFDEIDKILIKPKQLCFYSSTKLRSSISLYRIKSFYYENLQISIELTYSDRDLGQNFDKKFYGSSKYLILKNIFNIKQLYEDIVYYTELLQLGINRN